VSGSGAIFRALRLHLLSGAMNRASTNLIILNKHQSNLYIPKSIQMINCCEI